MPRQTYAVNCMPCRAPVHGRDRRRDRVPTAVRPTMPAADAVNPEDRMTKNDLVDQIADRAGLSKAQAGEALGAVLEAIEQGLARGEDVSITGFGKFTVAHRSA